MIRIINLVLNRFPERKVSSQQYRHLKWNYGTTTNSLTLFLYTHQEVPVFQLPFGNPLIFTLIDSWYVNID